MSHQEQQIDIVYTHAHENRFTKQINKYISPMYDLAMLSILQDQLRGPSNKR